MRTPRATRPSVALIALLLAALLGALALEAPSAPPTCASGEVGDGGDAAKLAELESQVRSLQRQLDGLRAAQPAAQASGAKKGASGDPSGVRV